MTALVIYIAIAGSNVPWLHKIAWYPSEAACNAALAQEVALANTKFVVHTAGCVDPQKAKPPVAVVTPRGR